MFQLLLSSAAQSAAQDVSASLTAATIDQLKPGQWDSKGDICSYLWQEFSLYVYFKTWWMAEELVGFDSRKIKNNAD